MTTSDNNRSTIYKKRILYVTNIPSPNRVSFFNEFGKLCDLTVTFELLRASDRDKKWVPEQIKHFKSINLKGVRTSPDGALCFGLFRILEKKWDCVIFGTYYTPTSMLGMQYMMIRNMDYVIEADGGFIKEENVLKRCIKKHFISNAAHWLTSGKFAVDYLLYYGADKRKCDIFPFSSIRKLDICNRITNEKEYIKRRKLARRELAVEGRFVVLTVAQFIYRKGIDILLRAIERCKADAEFFIVGGIATSEYLELANENPRIHFEGFKYAEELNMYFYAADLFVLPTREDVWGLVVNEALAYGIPVVTTKRCGAGIEIISQDKEGYIVPVEDSDSIAEIIYKLCKNNKKMKTLSVNAGQKSLKYTIENMVNYHVKYIEKYFSES